MKLSRNCAMAGATYSRRHAVYLRGNAAERAFRGAGGTARRCVPIALLLALLAALCPAGWAQDPLDAVHIPSPPVTDTEPDIPSPPGSKPGSKPLEGPAAMKARSNESILVNVNLVLVPVTVTDTMNRLVTGLEKQDFTLYDNNVRQTITSFSVQDAPVSIGIIFDLSGSMSDKLNRARKSIIQFLQTSNPQDEFFVIGFNDRPELVEDFTSNVDKIEARLLSVQSGHRTALLDAIYFGLNKMKQARYQRKALLVVSDGGDNHSRFTEGEVRSMVRESDVQIYAIGIFDVYAATREEQLGPLLLHDISAETGGQLFRVDDVGEMGDIAAKISAELRNEYVLGYTPENTKRDGKWRKLKVKLDPPPGLPQLSVHARTGYYAPAQ